MNDPQDPTKQAQRVLARGGSERQRERLECHVTHLASEIGPRNSYHHGALRRAAAFVEASLAEVVLVPIPQPYDTRGQSFANITAELTGADRRDEIVVVGAHYDTHKDSPGGR